MELTLRRATSDLRRMSPQIRRLTFGICVLLMVHATAGCLRKSDKIRSTWEDSNGRFKIRILSFDEGSAFVLGGLYYTFEAMSDGSTSWQELMTCRVKTGIRPEEHFMFINRDSAFAFLNSDFAVTVDAGRTWSRWDPNKDFRDANWNYGLSRIRNVKIDSKGVGVMLVSANRSMSPSTWKDVHYLTLQTTDFGRHWSRQITPSVPPPP